MRVTAHSSRLLKKSALPDFQTSRLLDTGVESRDRISKTEHRSQRRKTEKTIHSVFFVSFVDSGSPFLRSGTFVASCNVLP